MTTDKTSSTVVNPEAAKGADTAVDPRLLVREQGLGGYLTEFKRKMRGGDLGSIPVIIGLIIICVVFQSLNSEFLSAKNVSDIAVTMVATGMMAVGIIFVLLLGEIDLSVGSVSGVSGAVVAVLSVTHGMNEWLAILVAILSGAVIGAIHGFFFARIGAPAFAVTLAGLLFWLGFMLQLLGDTGTINLDSDGVVGNLTTYYFSDVAAAYGLAAVSVIGYFLSAFLDTRRREARASPRGRSSTSWSAPSCSRCSPSAPRSCSTSTRSAAGPGPLPDRPGRYGLRPAPHLLRPEDLRARRQRRGVPARRYQRHRDPRLGLLHRGHLRGDRRPLLGVQDRGGQPGLRGR